LTQIYHNPRCSKSRETLKLLENAKEEVEIILYLEIPPTPEQLKNLLSLLGMEPINLIRTGEKLWKEKYKGKKIAPSSLLEIMSKNPQLIERPIVVKNGKAALGRPPESVKEIL
jgi:arsenate reductase (glutaredoxin)